MNVYVVPGILTIVVIWAIFRLLARRDMHKHDALLHVALVFIAISILIYWFFYR